MNMTPVDLAFDYNTTIKNSQFKPLQFSKVCIFCNSLNSNPLMKDGSYRQCLTCLKCFKAKVAVEQVHVKV